MVKFLMKDENHGFFGGFGVCSFMDWSQLEAWQDFREWLRTWRLGAVEKGSALRGKECLPGYLVASFGDDDFVGFMANLLIG